MIHSATPTSTSQADAEAPGEKTFLTAEAGIAKQAMTAAWNDTKRELARGLDPRVWTGAHPLAALAAAAVAGFAATCAVVPTKEQEALKKLAELQRAIHGIKPGEEAKPSGKEKAKETEAAARKLGIAGMVSAELFKVIRPLLTSVLSSLVAARMSPEQAAEETGVDPDIAARAHAPAADSVAPPT